MKEGEDGGMEQRQPEAPPLGGNVVASVGSWPASSQARESERESMGWGV